MSHDLTFDRPAGHSPSGEPAAGRGTGVFDPRPIRMPEQEGARDAPACSVVMTAYEDFRFLDEAVDSVLRQEFADFELIVIDDGSSDPRPVAALAARDPRIRVLLSQVNEGTAAAANRAIGAARSEIIVRLDFDDMAAPGRIGRLDRGGRS